MKKLFTMLCMLTMVFSFTGCAETTQQELTNVGIYEDNVLELKNAEVFTNDEGQQMVRVYATYTNNAEDPMYALSCFAVRAFQNDVELNESYDINGDESELTREIKNGASIDVSYVFELPEESEVEVLIGTPTADMETIGRQVYFSSEE